MLEQLQARIQEFRVDRKLKRATTQGSIDWINSNRDDSERFDPLFQAFEAIAFGDPADTAAILLTDEAKAELDTDFRDELFRTAQQVRSTEINIETLIAESTPLTEGEVVDLQKAQIAISGDY